MKFVMTLIFMYLLETNYVQNIRKWLYLKLSTNIFILYEEKKIQKFKEIKIYMRQWSRQNVQALKQITNFRNFSNLKKKKHKVSKKSQYEEKKHQDGKKKKVKDLPIYRNVVFIKISK